MYNGPVMVPISLLAPTRVSCRSGTRLRISLWGQWVVTMDASAPWLGTIHSWAQVVATIASCIEICGHLRTTLRSWSATDRRSVDSSGRLTTSSLLQAATTTSCFCGARGAAPSLSSSSTSTRLRSRQSPGPHTSKAYWRQVVAPRIGQLSSGTQ